MAKFVAEFNETCEVFSNKSHKKECGVDQMERPTWHVFIDGAHNFNNVDLSVVIIDHNNNCFEFVVRLYFQENNSVAEYEAAKFGAMTSKRFKVDKITLHNDSWQMVNQSLEKFEARDGKIKGYLPILAPWF